MAGGVAQIQRLVPGLIEKPGGETQAKTAVDGGFLDALKGAIGSVNDLHSQAAQAQDALLAGDPVELHEVMIKAEEAGLATDLLLEIRNKLVNAYNEIMRMPM
jgi:flagellar hook-basal body complex protein FliE